MEVVHVETRVHGRSVVVQRGVRNLVVGFHGYAETAEVHLAELARIPGIDAWNVAAIQALHPFYTRAGEVVASWMTSVDRELAIADNVEYVRRVIERLPAADKLVFAGFSQGAAMAYRAAAAFRCEGVVILGGDLPDDVELRKLPPILIGRGARDEWFTSEKLKNNLNSLSEASVELFEFDGGHEWTDAFRERAGEFLKRIAE